jgi:hypothetical protein
MYSYYLLILANKPLKLLPFGGLTIEEVSDLLHTSGILLVNSPKKPNYGIPFETIRAKGRAYVVDDMESLVLEDIIANLEE